VNIARRIGIPVATGNTRRSARSNHKLLQRHANGDIVMILPDHRRSNDSTHLRRYVHKTDITVSPGMFFKTNNRFMNLSI
jgi:hypothetical protein